MILRYAAFAGTSEQIKISGLIFARTSRDIGEAICFERPHGTGSARPPDRSNPEHTYRMCRVSATIRVSFGIWQESY